MGYFRGLTHGAIIGAILGLLYAPESGINTRRRVARLLGQAEEMLPDSPSGAATTPSPSRRRAVGGMRAGPSAPKA